MSKLLTPIEMTGKALQLAHASVGAQISLVPHMWWLGEQQQKQVKAMLENQQAMIKNMPGYPQA